MLMMKNNLNFLGNQSLLDLPNKIAFLSSDRFSAGSVLASYDWAAKVKRQGQCVISGFHSKLECDVFDILLRGSQPIVWVLARCIYADPPAKYRRHINSGRLLIISQFGATYKRASKWLAEKRNRLVVDLAESVVVAHIYAGGMLEKILAGCAKPVRVLDR
jgi:predicted Rossmann fold nucleotide-binding protein DprA/Smf involved in DNA uptake